MRKKTNIKTEHQMISLLAVQNILLVQRQMSVKERDVETFQQALKIYTDATSSQLNNLQYGPFYAPQCLCVSQDLFVICCNHFKSLHFSPTYDNPHFLSLFLCFIMFFSVSVQNLPDRSCFIMYEFWQDRLSWMRQDQRGFTAYQQRKLVLKIPFLNSNLLSLKCHCLVERQIAVSCFFISFLSAICSRPSVRPSNAALLTHWRNRRLSPPCSSQVKTFQMILTESFHTQNLT